MFYLLCVSELLVQSIFSRGMKIESLFFAVVSYHRIGYLFEKE